MVLPMLIDIACTLQKEDELDGASRLTICITSSRPRCAVDVGVERIQTNAPASAALLFSSK